MRNSRGTTSRKLLRPFGLETFSFACAKRLLELHPDWLPHIHSEEVRVERLSVRTLAINLPSENPNVREPLTITTDFDKIIAMSWFTIKGNSRWNVDWVFFMPAVREKLDWPNDNYGFDIVAEFIDSFIQEDFAACWSDDGQGQGGTTGIIAAEQLRSGDIRRGRARTIVHSWRGSLDLLGSQI